ncbi:MAG: ATP-binding cassette domain-containing protein [Cyclobacteriaceae bacterium]|nr:ATP-binding cassette domain-containing protein [Cyclobacteriaceae bacterium HetDA_MAG_MS6]
MFSIILENFSVRREDESILSSTSFMVSRGETHAIYGPGGSGKSLLMRYVYGQKANNLIYQEERFSLQTEGIYYLNINHPGGSTSSLSLPDDKDLYLIDEPENGYTIDSFQYYHDGIKRKGSTLVFVTHRLDFIESFADKVTVLKHGDHVGSYRKEDFFNNSDPYISYLAKMGC